MKDIGFTGTKRGLTSIQEDTLRLHLQKLFLPGTRFHHGDCVGADAKAHDIARKIGYWIILHPPKNGKFRAYKLADEVREPQEYLDRNLDIVLESDHLIATPGERGEQLRSGTWATVRMARRAQTPVDCIFPSGELE